jgi:predicted secreted hydrolase
MPPRTLTAVARRLIAPVAILGSALVIAGCSPTAPTPTATIPPTPTPTPAYGLPPLSLPADEAAHGFQTEWWYFNVHLASPDGSAFTLHDVVFQIQEPASGRTLYTRQVGLGDVRNETHATSERVLTSESPLAGADDGFEFPVGGGLVSGSEGEAYRLVGAAGGFSYDLSLHATTPALLHDHDGLVDFGPAGISYYYTRPRLETSGSVTTADGRVHAVTGLGWLDKQWGNFIPVQVAWDWASVQLDDGTDLMLSRLMDRDMREVDLYATLRRPGQPVRRLGPTDFTFAPVAGAEWLSAKTGTTYATRWSVAIPAEGLQLTLEPLILASEFESALLGVTYYEAGVRVLDADEQVGQGFIELNWPRGTER